MNSRGRGGRPPKFREPRRPITVTLPERTLRKLAMVSADRARAIVKLADATVPDDSQPAKLVELIPVTHDAALIVVGPSRCLPHVPGLRLVEIAPARYLLTIPSGTALESLEVAIMDEIESLPDTEGPERALLLDLRSHLAGLRRTRRMSKEEIILVALEKSG